MLYYNQITRGPQFMHTYRIYFTFDFEKVAHDVEIGKNAREAITKLQKRFPKLKKIYCYEEEDT